MRHLILAIPFIFMFLGTASADRDPRCKDSSLIAQAAIVDATVDSTIEFCSPSHGATGVPYPDTGPPMTCTVYVSGEAVATIADVGPEQLITYTDPVLRFAHVIDIVCANDQGEGRLDEIVTAIFLPDAPGRPYVVSGN